MLFGVAVCAIVKERAATPAPAGSPAVGPAAVSGNPASSVAPAGNDKDEEISKLKKALEKEKRKSSSGLQGLLLETARKKTAGGEDEESGNPF